jgi:hypothetical protein
MGDRPRAGDRRNRAPGSAGGLVVFGLLRASRTQGLPPLKIRMAGQEPMRVVADETRLGAASQLVAQRRLLVYSDL